MCTLSLYHQLLLPWLSEKNIYIGSRPQPGQARLEIPKIPLSSPERPPLHERLDTILGRLQSGNIVFNAPVTLQRDRWDVIELVLSYKDSIDRLENLITAAGKKIKARVRISDRMEAQLYGGAFDIKAATPSIQAVSKVESTQWKWEIKPKESGLQYLYLTLYAMLSVDGEQTPRSIHTYKKNIEVYVTWPQKLSDFVSNNWQWLWTAILIPIAGRLLPKQNKKQDKVESSDIC